MIQRIQTLYLALSIICLTIVTFGTTIFTLNDALASAKFSVYGLEITQTSGEKSHESAPYFVSTIALILLCLLTIFSYKNLKNQFKVARVTAVVYAVLAVLLVAYAWMAHPLHQGEKMSLNLGPGLFLFKAGMIFVFMAILGIRKDKNLLDSLNRLR